MEDETPESRLAEILARAAFAAMAFGVTFLGGHWIGLHAESTKEIAVLNAAVAYYTHEAAGSVVHAINRALDRIPIRNQDDE